MIEEVRADLIQCISPSELKQIKNYSLDVLKKLKEIYESICPSRKTSLLKSLIQHKVPDSSPCCVYS